MRCATTILATFFIFGVTALPPAHAQEVQNSQWDSSVQQVEDWLMENLRDPDSYESIEWYEVQKGVGDDGQTIYAARHKYRSKNSLGGYVVNDDVFLLDESGEVTTRVSYEAWKTYHDMQSPQP